MPDLHLLAALHVPVARISVDTWVRVLADALKLPQPLTHQHYLECRALLEPVLRDG